jgi:hypothetical protein
MADFYVVTFQFHVPTQKSAGFPWISAITDSKDTYMTFLKINIYVFDT